jgi:hypothetical protein
MANSTNVSTSILTSAGGRWICTGCDASAGVTAIVSKCEACLAGSPGEVKSKAAQHALQVARSLLEHSKVQTDVLAKAKAQHDITNLALKVALREIEQLQEQCTDKDTVIADLTSKLAAAEHLLRPGSANEEAGSGRTVSKRLGTCTRRAKLKS